MPNEYAEAQAKPPVTNGAAIKLESRVLRKVLRFTARVYKKPHEKKLM
jgi:hypothetical protein